MSDDLTPTMERELAAVDDALATGTASAADPVERELRDLAVALRAEAPTPDPAFSRHLRERVDTGFAPAADPPRGGLAGGLLRLREREGAARGRLAGGWRRALPSLSGASLGAGAVAALLVAIVVAVSLDTGGGRTADDAGSGGGAATALQEDAPGPADGDTGAAAPDEGAAQSLEPAPPTPPPGRDGFAPGREQRIARAAALTLEAPGNELGRVAERVTAVTDRHSGFVLRSSVTSGDEGDAGGTLELRIPAAELRNAVRDLSALATVTSSTQSGEDVTGSFISARDRLEAARAERVSLLDRLEEADTDVEAESLRSRLDLVAREINGLRGQLRELRLRTSYAAVNVTLDPADDDAGAAAGGSTQDALDDALGSLQGTLNVALRVLGVALPLAVLGLLGWLVYRTILRRRRESVLA